MILPENTGSDSFSRSYRPDPLFAGEATAPSTVPQDTGPRPLRGNAYRDLDNSWRAAPAPSSSRLRHFWTRLLTGLAPILYLLSKLKFLALFGKFGLTAVSMLVSVWVYAAAWGLGWPAAVGFVVLLFVHEMGHWVVMRQKGVPATAPLFIPFLGAVIGMKGMPRTATDEAEIGIAGPLAGTAAALVCLVLGNLYGGHLWPLLAMMGLYLNLFNLLPVSPLDGGRIVAAISRWLWLVGLAGLVGFVVLNPNPFLILVLLIGGAQTIARFRGRYTPTARPGYDDVRPQVRLIMGVLYFGLIALIGMTMLSSPLMQL